ncbi:MAG: class I SAM-dependent methyltransferase [Acidobacteriota bacterium]
MLPPVAERYVLKDFPHSSHRTLVSWVGQDPARILDVGAARGFLGELLGQVGHTVVGIERDPEAARLAAPHYAALHVADAQHLGDIPEAPFDVIVAGDVLEHLAEPLAALRDLVGMLAPGGRVIVTVPNVAFLAIRVGLACGRFDYRPRGILDGTHLRFFTWRSLHRLCVDAGLRVVRMSGIPPPLPLVHPRFARWPLRALLEAAAIAARLWPTLFAYQLAAEAVR